MQMLNQRLSMDAAGVIAHYVMDGDQPLTAETGGNNTYYLYGLGAIGEKTMRPARTTASKSGGTG
jgi:hypothetical protein